MQAASRSGRRRRRVSIARALAFAASTRRISPGRSRSSGRIRLRFRALTARPRLLQKQAACCAAARRLRPARRSSLRKPTRSPQTFRDMPSARVRARPGSVSIGWEIPRLPSSCRSVPIFTTALSGIALFLAAHAAATGEQAFKGAGAGGGRALAQEPERPQRSAHGAIPGHRRRHRAGLDRLCARGDGEVSARTMTCSRTRMRRRTCSVTT